MELLLKLLLLLVLLMILIVICFVSFKTFLALFLWLKVPALISKGLALVLTYFVVK